MVTKKNINNKFEREQIYFDGNDECMFHPDHITLIEAESGLSLLMKLLPATGSVFGAQVS